MNRRTVLVAAAAFAIAPLAAAADFVNYRPGVIQGALADGKTVLVDYAANWCSTCKRQERVINALRAANPAYDAGIVFVRVDWDRYGNDRVTKDRRIPRRSTLVLLRGDQELGRVVAQTRESAIQALLDLGL